MAHSEKQKKYCFVLNALLIWIGFLDLLLLYKTYGRYEYNYVEFLEGLSIVFSGDPLEIHNIFAKIHIIMFHNS